MRIRTHEIEPTLVKPFHDRVECKVTDLDEPAPVSARHPSWTWGRKKLVD
jgi:hypothetical protein